MRSNCGVVLQVDTFDERTLLSALPDEVGEVLERLVALLLHLEGVLALLAELFHRPLEVEDNVVLGCVEYLADGARDSVRVVVHILHGGKLS